jgi:hypothetical protein
MITPTSNNPGNYTYELSYSSYPSCTSGGSRPTFSQVPPSDTTPSALTNDGTGSSACHWVNMGSATYNIDGVVTAGVGAVGGNGYEVGTVIGLPCGAEFTVTSVGAEPFPVTGISLLEPGTHCALQNNQIASTLSGTGLGVGINVTSINGNLYTTDYQFGAQNNVLSGSPDGNWVAIASGSLLTLGLDNNNRPFSGLFIIHIGQASGAPPPPPSGLTVPRSTLIMSENEMVVPMVRWY